MSTLLTSASQKPGREAPASPSPHAPPPDAATPDSPTPDSPTPDARQSGATPNQPTSQRIVRRRTTAVLFAATILSGLSAGFFFTYEISVTEGLALTDDTTYVATFQAINATVRSLRFAIVFFGTVPAVVVATFMARRLAGPSRWLLGIGGVLALAVIIITFAVHVPMNTDLALVDASVPDLAGQARADFEARWNQWHSYRTACSIFSFMCVAAASALSTSTVSRRHC